MCLGFRVIGFRALVLRRGFGCRAVGFRRPKAFSWSCETSPTSAGPVAGG